MSQQRRASAPDGEPPIKAMGDPWQAFGYVTSGVALYGFVGWLLDRWWGTGFMVAIGILAGAALGIYMTFGRFGRPSRQRDETQHDETPGTSETGRTEE
jgi:ATP synthase protein I